MQVQNLIERCILFHMSQDQCVRALAEHAGIKPLVTVTGPYLFLITRVFWIGGSQNKWKIALVLWSLCYTWCLSRSMIVWVNLFLCSFVQCGKSFKRRTRSSLEHICKLPLPGHYSWVRSKLPCPFEDKAALNF